MSVVSYGEVVSQVFDAMAEASERGELATKVLMSQRQYDVFIQVCHLFVRGVEYPSTVFKLPIVICPDCDLYVVCSKTIPRRERPDGLLPLITVEKNIGSRW